MENSVLLLDELRRLEPMETGCDVCDLIVTLTVFTVLLAAKETPPPSGRRRCDACVRAGVRAPSRGKQR